MSGPVALVDANVFYSAPLRDLMMELALCGLFRARWTARIEDEWIRSLLANRPDISPATLDGTRALMLRAVPDARIEGYEGLINSLVLPDPDDRHVLAAAIKAEADVIVTLNCKDFPPDLLRPHGIEALHPDSFIASFTVPEPLLVIAAARECRTRLKRPALSTDDYLDVLSRIELSETGAFLARNKTLI